MQPPPQPTTIIVSQVGVVRAEVAPAAEYSPAARLLAALATGPLRVAELARAVGQSTSWVYQQVRPLVESGAVFRERGVYRLGQEKR